MMKTSKTYLQPIGTGSLILLSTLFTQAPDRAVAAEKPILDTQGWNREVRPQDDFFAFANGG